MSDLANAIVGGLMCFAPIVFLVLLSNAGNHRPKNPVSMSVDQFYGRQVSGEGSMEPHDHVDFHPKEQHGHSSYFSPEAIDARLEQRSREFVDRLMEQYPSAYNPPEAYSPPQIAPDDMPAPAPKPAASEPERPRDPWGNGSMFDL